MGFVRLVSPFFLKFSNENHCGNFGAKLKILLIIFFILSFHKIYFNGKREYDPKFQKNNKKEILSELSSFEIMERDLDPGTEYTIYMTASTSIGEGNRSDSIIINTLVKGECRSVTLIVNLHIALFPLCFVS